MIVPVDFPRTRRLLLPTDYSAVFSRNVRVSDQYWTILAGRRQAAAGLANKWQDNQGEIRYAGSRLGLAIAKKRAKRAVDRNRLKRLVREYFRHHAESLNSVDMVVMNRDQAGKASNEELRQSLASLWLKLEEKCKN